jgi:hypothetical protein
MRRLRLRLWQIMIAVVLLATLAFAERMRRRRAMCRVRAIHYANIQRNADDYLSICKRILADCQRRLERARKTLRDCDQPYLRRYFESRVRQEEGRVAESEERVRTAEGRLMIAMRKVSCGSSSPDLLSEGPCSRWQPLDSLASRTVGFGFIMAGHYHPFLPCERG